MNKKLNKIFNTSNKIVIDDNSKIVIMSDCHRGCGDNYDSFIKNKNIYESALKHYYDSGFTYIELGDGDELWEVDDYNEIIEEHLSTFKILSKFNNSNRLIMIYGNHDIYKKSDKILKKYFYNYHNKINNKKEKLLYNLTCYEAIILNYKGKDMFLIHGHQVDFLNGIFWPLSRFLVRNVWRHLEKYGFKAPTSAAKNHKVSKRVEKRLTKWARKNNKIIISGHTHRPIFPKIGQMLYFNDGSCIHPNGITCLEIENGTIKLIKWQLNLQKNTLISVGRKIIENKEPITNFYLKHQK